MATYKPAIGLGMQVDRIGMRMEEIRKQRDKLVAAVQSCLPDLEHYAATHGPGPDKRLDALKLALDQVS